MRLKDRPAVTQEIEVIIDAISEDPIIYIDGLAEIKLDRYSTYTLMNEITK
jgi:hypothetical protein